MYVSSDDRTEIIQAYNEIIFKTRGDRGPNDAEVRAIAREVMLPVVDVVAVIEAYEEAEYDKAAARSVGRDY